MKQLAARINPRPAQPVRTRTRLGLAAAVTATMVAVVGATGGFSSAASTISGATHSVVHIAHISSTPSALVKNAAAPRVHTSGPTSADTQYAVAPTISGFTPNSGPSGQTVTVQGTHFSGASAVSSVSLGDSPAAPNVISDSTLTFQVPAGATSGDITVANAAGPATSTDSFTVIQIPQFSGDTPYSPADGGVGTAVTLSGTNFTGVTSVTIGGKAAPIDSISNTEIDTEVPTGAKVGTGSITIKNAAGSASASGFVVDSGAPTVTSFSPASGSAGDSIKITGTNLLTGDKAADVMFNGAADAATLTDGKTPTKTALYVNVPDDAESGAITVSNDLGNSTSKTSFVVLGTPNITGVNPAFGIKNTPVIITGDTFTGAKNVIFHSSGHPDVTVSSGLTIKGDTQITVKAPSTLVQGATYSVEVTGKTLDVSDPAGSFYFEAKPAIDSLTPNQGGTGLAVAIAPPDGNTFLGVTKVTFGGKAATITSNTPTEVDVLVPAGLNSSTTPKSVAVVVSNAAGPSLASTFTAVNSAPTIKTYAPSAGNVGDTLTITGSFLNNNDTSVTFLSGDSCTVANDDLTKRTTGTGSKAVDSISFEIPDCAATGLIEVDNADGSATGKSFTVYQQPVVLGIKPAYGSSKASTKVTVQGAPGTFTGAFEVDFDAHAVKTGIVVAKDGASLTVTAPKLAAATYKVTVSVNKLEPLSGDSGNTGLTILDAPTVTGFGDTDTGGMAGDTLTVKGTNFLGVQSVTFGSVKAVFQAVVSGGAIDPTQLTVTIPNGAISNKISVTTAGGKGTSSATYPVLAISKVSPASAKHGKANQTITVTGTGFKFNNVLVTLNVGGETVVPKSSSKDTSLVFTLPTDLAAGNVTIDLTNDLGEVTATLKLT